ncbi:MAG TPA: hypothetical protein VKT99_04750 [Xanthobacteraceae bacterium]|nr:hypothetical protein [Xanthobacteraceae bacterium]
MHAIATVIATCKAIMDQAFIGFRLGFGVARGNQSNQKGTAADSAELFQKIAPIKS